VAIAGLPVEGDGFKQIRIRSARRLCLFQAVQDPGIPAAIAAGFCGALLSDIHQSLANVRKHAPECPANVIRDHLCDCLEAVFRQRCVDRIATAGANSEKPNALFLHIRKRCQEIDRATNVFDPGGRIFEVSRLAAALALAPYFDAATALSGSGTGRTCRRSRPDMASPCTCSERRSSSRRRTSSAASSTSSSA